MKNKITKKRLQQVRRKLAANVSKRREQLGLTQQALADMSGIHRTHVSLIERRCVDPSLVTVWRLATALRTKVGNLMR